MRQRNQPPPETPPVDRARVHELVAALHAAHCGEPVHVDLAEPGQALKDICGGSCMVTYYLLDAFNDPAGLCGASDPPPPLPSVDEMTDHIVKCAPFWAEDRDRVRHPSRYS